jgi:hypothetical protein
VFDVPVETISELASETGKLELNRNLINLSPKQRTLVRNAVAAARARTNAGR